jgi:anti-anti-sigma factor
MQLCKLQPTQPEALDIFVVELVGEFDFSECERLTDTFEITKTAPLVFVDLSKASYLDSTALQCLVNLRNASCKRSAGLVLLGVQGVIARLFEVSGLGDVFDMRSNLCEMGMGSLVTKRLTLESRSVSDAPSFDSRPVY